MLFWWVCLCWTLMTMENGMQSFPWGSLSDLNLGRVEKNSSLSETQKIAIVVKPESIYSIWMEQPCVLTHIKTHTHTKCGKKGCLFSLHTKSYTTFDDAHYLSWYAFLRFVPPPPFCGSPQVQENIKTQKYMNISEWIWLWMLYLYTPSEKITN